MEILAISYQYNGLEFETSPFGMVKKSVDLIAYLVLRDNDEIAVINYKQMLRVGQEGGDYYSTYVNARGKLSGQRLIPAMGSPFWPLACLKNDLVKRINQDLPKRYGIYKPIRY